MRSIPIFILFAVLTASCSSDTKPVESKWRVLDEQIYAPRIDEETVFTDLDELEKLMFAPTGFFKEKSGMHSFEQKMAYLTNSVVNEEKRELTLEETVKFSSDKDGNFKMRYRNNRHEGWSMVWKDNFLYRRQLGGEYTRTVSMGEHVYLKESLFSSIPSVYAMLRNNARISSHDRKKINGSMATAVIISFGDKKIKREELPEKRYLQNLQGTEEMKNDQLIYDLAEKEKKNITGEMTVFVDDNYSVVRMEIKSSFELKAENVFFSIEGERTLSKKVAEKVEIPKYNEEYHRRTLDASVNIMKDRKNDKERDEQTEESDQHSE
ncbi:MAG TPA: hypothetical protein PL195_08190 [bacterium]|jgi:hypothetical protein|nr:hypothetical protein [bacterium]HQI05227.1 hypothetical protein [bacterium]HQJ60470.1 hypothetical protein [bacterium]